MNTMTLICEDEYMQIADIIRSIISNVLVTKRFDSLANMQDKIDVFLSLGCCIEYEELVKLLSSNTIFSIIEYCPIIKRDMLTRLNTLNLGKNIVLLVQPIIGTIKIIIGRGKILFDYIKTIRISLGYEILNNIGYFYKKLLHNAAAEKHEILINYIKDIIGIDLGIKQLDVQLHHNYKFIEVDIEGVQFSKWKKLKYQIAGEIDANQFLVAEICSYIQLVISGNLDKGILTSENIGGEEGFFTYYMGNLIKMLNIQVDIEFINK